MENITENSIQENKTVEQSVVEQRAEERKANIENFAFDFSVLADFCKTKNHGMAHHNGNTIPPRVQFLLDLIAKVGLTAELDVWEANRFERGTTLADILNFGYDDIDSVVDGMDHLNNEEKNEEKRVLRIAFENFYKTQVELTEISKALENTPNVSKAEKRIYKMMLKFKNDIANTPKNNCYYNIYIKGTSKVAVMAHHDIVNPKSDNCNDNSASCINVIATKLLNPDVHVIINDAEEIGGLGAERSAQKIHEGFFGEIDFVLNLELTAVGGKNFFVEKFSESKLYNRIINLFPGVDIYSTPFHDGMIMRRHGIDSVVINPLPRNRQGELEYSLLHLCHSSDDSIRLANYTDMRDFVTAVVTPIIDGRSEFTSLNEPTAPLDTILCEAAGFFDNDNSTVKIVEKDNIKLFELKTVNSKGEENIEYFKMIQFRQVYSEWKRNKRYNMKTVTDVFNNYTYV